MKQIDQEPHDYRAKPVKGEPVFQPGGLRRLGLWMLGMAVSLAIAIPLYFIFTPIADVLVDWMLGRL